MIDPKFNELPANPAGDADDFSDKRLAAEQESGSSAKPRTGLSINDTVASDAMLSSGSRGTDTSGVRAGAGAGAGSSFVSPVGSGSPAVNVVPGARGSGTTPVSARATEQTPTMREDTGGSERSGRTSGSPSSSLEGSSSYTNDEVAARAYDFWCERGCPQGSPEVDWRRAEQEVRERSSRPKSSAASV